VGGRQGGPRRPLKDDAAIYISDDTIGGGSTLMETPMASWSSTHVQCDGCRQSSLIWSLRGVCCVRRSRGIPVSVGIVGGRRHPDGDDAVGDSGVRHHTCAAVANDWTPAKHRPPDLWRSEIVAGSPERPETHICHKAVPLGTAPVLTAVKTRGGGVPALFGVPKTRRQGEWCCLRLGGRVFQS
jgi:hypothetical protein